MKIVIPIKPALEPHDTKDEHFILLKPFTVCADGMVITVPKGFVSDGASIPLVYRGELPAWGAGHSEAAIVHDYLYSDKSEGVENLKSIDRGKADKIFYAIMKHRRCHWWKARMMYTAVRLFGFTRWRK
jgi:hypothetical protein